MITKRGGTNEYTGQSKIYKSYSGIAGTKEKRILLYGYGSGFCGSTGK